ncbi:MAG: GNAT family N-acetyltransferase [Phycisphaerales bacterium]|jgi:predicted GNAT family N-acyltransferase
MLAVRRISGEETRPLRQKILRPHQTIAELNFPADDAPTTAHFGGFVDNTLAGVASLYVAPSKHAPEDRLQWQLRGMATDGQGRGCGLGGMLLRACLQHATEHGGGTLWCNARSNVIGFYERFGLRVVSDEFTPAGLGPHRVMLIDLD